MYTNVDYLNVLVYRKLKWLFPTIKKLERHALFLFLFSKKKIFYCEVDSIISLTLFTKPIAFFCKISASFSSNKMFVE